MAVCLVFTPTDAQQDEQKQDIPDAPSATRPPQSFPAPPPSANPQPPPPAGQTPPTTSSPAPQPPPAQPPLAPGSAPPRSAVDSGTPLPPPPMKITTVPEGGATEEREASGQDLYKFTVSANQVLVPVMVKDESGHLLSGLLPRDFTVFEDRKKQPLNFFTSDAFAMSAAVIIDLSMPDTAVEKVKKTFPALEGAFSVYDEVAIYTYSSNVSRMSSFAAAGKKLNETLNELKTVSGRNNGVPVMDGPLGPQGPIVNGVPLDQGTIHPNAPPREYHVLNDAILAAAVDLGKRDRSRRKVIFVISDGRESNSKASYRDVLKVLLTNGILVYGVAVEGSAIPVYGKLERFHLKKFGFGDILPKYANATGGEILTGFSPDVIEDTYAAALGDARNQYTLGYMTRATVSSTYREIEVRVARPGCKSSSVRPCVDVIAKTGYYPAGGIR